VEKSQEDALDLSASGSSNWERVDSFCQFGTFFERKRADREDEEGDAPLDDVMHSILRKHKSVACLPEKDMCHVQLTVSDYLPNNRRSMRDMIDRHGRLVHVHVALEQGGELWSHALPRVEDQTRIV
jgi:hypothetical protein